MSNMGYKYDLRKHKDVVYWTSTYRITMLNVVLKHVMKFVIWFSKCRLSVLKMGLLHDLRQTKKKNVYRLSN